MLESLIEGDFKVALPNDPQTNPETLINILNNVFGKWLIPIHYSKNLQCEMSYLYVLTTNHLFLGLKAHLLL